MFAAAREPPPRALTRISPMVRRLVAPNASPFTFNGTCTYIVGKARSRSSIRAPTTMRITPRCSPRSTASGSTPFSSPIPIAITSADANKLRSATGAQVVGAAPFTPRGDGSAGLDSAHDRDYSPDRILGDGELWQGAGYTIEALATPGHCSNHLCFALLEEDALSFRRSRHGLVDIGGRAARRFDARLYGVARQAARTPRDDLLAWPRRPRRRTATIPARADPSPAPARSLDPERAGGRPADDSGPRRQDLCRA